MTLRNSAAGCRQHAVLTIAAIISQGARVPSGQDSRGAGQRRCPERQNQCRGHRVQEPRSSWTCAWLTDAMPHICLCVCLNRGPARGGWWFGWRRKKNLRRKWTRGEADGIELKLVKKPEPSEKCVKAPRGGVELGGAGPRRPLALARQLMTGLSRYNVSYGNLCCSRVPRTAQLTLTSSLTAPLQFPFDECNFK